MEANVQKTVADTLLQRPVRVQIGDREYNVAPPTIGTLAIVSEYLCDVPEFNSKAEGNDYFFEVLGKAKDCRPIACAIAALILGSKHWDDVAESSRRGLFARIGHRNRPILKRDVLIKEILDNVSPSALTTIVNTIFQRMEIADFFAITIFLGGVHTTKPTKMGTEAIRRGQLSPES